MSEGPDSEVIYVPPAKPLTKISGGQRVPANVFVPNPGPQGPAGVSAVLPVEDGDDSWVPGPAGPKGPTGSTGSQGVQGPQGAQGAALPGPAGEDADDFGWQIPGNPGIQGPQGGAGGQGPPGVYGIQGDDGDDALPIPGAPGIQGIQGVQGVQGPLKPLWQGEDGDDAWPLPGVAGPQGATGAAGASTNALEAVWTTPPLYAAFTGSATVLQTTQNASASSVSRPNSTTSTTLLLGGSSGSQNDDFSGMFVNISNSGAGGVHGWQVVARFKIHYPSLYYQMMGLAVSDGTNYYGAGAGSWAGASGMVYEIWTSGSTGGASGGGFLAWATSETPVDIWMKVLDDATHRFWYFSWDGLSWNTLLEESRTRILTHTQVGWGGTNHIGGSYWGTENVLTSGTSGVVNTYNVLVSELLSWQYTDLA